MSERSRGGSLFTPTLEGKPKTGPPPGQRPWRVESQFYAGFFGGPITITLIAYQNAGRLGMSRDEQRRIAIVGGTVTALMVIVASWFAADPARLAPIAATFQGIRPARILRFMSPASGVLLYLLFAVWMRSANRTYAAFGAGEYDSLVKPALKAMLIGTPILIAGFIVAIAFFALFT